jgi:hypothetical protein
MKVKLNLKPGDRGTKKLSNQFGDKLLCVRYRYDETTHKRFKTVELIVDEVPWSPQPAPNTPVLLKIHWNEKTTREKIKKAGGKWNEKRKLWVLKYDAVKKLGLTSRIRKD